jgi:hypothetical protein
MKPMYGLGPIEAIVVCVTLLFWGVIFAAPSALVLRILVPIFVISFGILCVVRARTYSERRADWNRRWHGWGCDPAAVKYMTRGFVAAGIFFVVWGVLVLLGVIKLRLDKLPDKEGGGARVQQAAPPANRPSDSPVSRAVSPPSLDRLRNP